MLSQNILKVQPAAFVESQLDFALVYFHFFRGVAMMSRWGWPVKKIEFGRDLLRGGFQAPVALDFHGDLQPALDTNVSWRTGQ